MKRAQELRVDEFSVQKLRESHGTIQRLTSQVQELQERMNYLNDFGEFQEVESNYSGRLSHVPSQPAVVPSSRTMLSRDKRLPLETWNLSGPQENVLAVHILCSSQHKHLVKEFIIVRHQVLQDRFQCILVQELLSQKVKNELSAGRRPWVHYCRWDSAEFYGWTAKTADIGSSIWKIPTPSTLRDGRFIGWITLVWMLAIRFWKEFSKFWNVMCANSSALNKIIHNSQFKKKVRKKTGFYEEDGPPSWSTTDFGLLALMIQCWITLIYSLSLFAKIMFRSSIQDGTKFYYLCREPWFCRELCWPIDYQSSKWWCSGIRFETGRNSIIDDTNPIWWHHGMSVQIENTWVWSTQNRIRIAWHGNSSEDIGDRGSKMKTMEKRSIDQKLRLRNFDARHGKIETGTVVKSRKGLKWRWKRKRYLLPVERKWALFEGRPVQFRAWEWWSCTKTDTESRSTLQAIIDARYKREKSSVRGRSQTGRTLRQPCQILFERCLFEITLWVLASSRMSILKNWIGM